MEKHKPLIALVALILVIVGALNWLLVGLFNTDIVYNILGFYLSHLVYIIVGAAGVYLIVFFKELPNDLNKQLKQLHGSSDEGSSDQGGDDNQQ